MAGVYCWLEREVISNFEPQAPGVLEEIRNSLGAFAVPHCASCDLDSDRPWKAIALSDFRLSQRTELLAEWGEANSCVFNTK